MTSIYKKHAMPFYKNENKNILTHYIKNKFNIFPNSIV